MKRFLFFSIYLLFVLESAAQENWRQEAAERIEKHRKADVTLAILRDGKPAAGAEVEIKMLRHKFLFGSNIFKWGRCRTPEENELYNRRYAELYNFATLGFYWWSYEGKIDQPRYTYSEQVADWCRSNGIRTKGHPLAWNFVDPSWAKDIDDPQLYRRQMDRITACGERFLYKIDTWDVINEVAEWDRKKCREQSPRLTALMEKHDPVEFAKTCFLAARKGNSGATLLINDYQLGEKYVELIEKLVDADGKPLYDVIGLQSHMHGGTWDNRRLWETCERFARFGVPLHFTELTILSTDKPYQWDGKDPTPTTEEGERKQRDEVVRVYTMLFSHPSVEAITWWDFCDQGSWMNAPAGMLRDDLSPKPAYDALRKLVHETWSTKGTFKTDADGKVSLRAFHGNYEIRIKLPDGSWFPHKFPVDVIKGKNALQFELTP